MAFVWMDGAAIEAEKAFIPLNDRGFRYGDGVFDTMRFSSQSLFQGEFHLHRLMQGLSALKIAYDCSALLTHAQALIRQNQLGSGLVRIQITRGSGGRGYQPSPDTMPRCVIETIEAPPALVGTHRLAISSYQKISPKALPTHAKLCQGINSTLARLQATEKNCLDAVLLSTEGHVAETSSANVFWSKGGTIYTPSLATGALEGSVRHWILKHVPQVQQVESPLAALQEAESIYLTNSAWGIVPISNLEGVSHTLSQHPKLEELRSSLLSIW